MDPLFGIKVISFGFLASLLGVQWRIYFQNKEIIKLLKEIKDQKGNTDG